MNTSYTVTGAAHIGDFWPAQMIGTGPASYLATGDPIANPAAGDYIAHPLDCMTVSGNYSLQAVPSLAQINQPRCGAPSATQSGWRWYWFYSGAEGVTSVTQNAAGSGMTPGTYPLTFTGGGGSGAAGTVTVLTATTIATPVITNAGTGYTSAPTTSAATGGTPPTFTTTVAPSGGVVPAGTNLSGEQVVFSAMMTQL